MSHLFRFCGVVGVVVLLFGVLGTVLLGSTGAHFLVITHLILGGALVAVWFFTNGLKNVGQAGAVISGRTARFGFNVAAYTAVFFGLLVVINLFAKWNNKRWDFTEQGVYSLADKSKQMVERLQKPLKLVGIRAGEAGFQDRLEDLLKLYKHHGGEKVSVEMLEARAKPVEIQRLGMKPGNLVYIEYGTESEKAVNRINEVTEQAVTNAILKLIRGDQKKIYYIQGHGEPNLDSTDANGLKAFSGALEDDQLKMESLLLLQKGSIPDDASAVVLAAPQKPLTSQEREVIIKYAQDGGRLILFADPEIQGNTDVQEIARQFEIEVGSDVIIDEGLRVLGGALAVQFVAGSVGSHPVTAGLKPPELPVFAFASSVTAKRGTSDKVVMTDIVKSGPSSWAEKNLELLFNSEAPSAGKEPDDIAGPVTVGVTYEKNLDDAKGTVADGEAKFKKAARVAVFGDISWITNAGFGMLTNRDLALNVVNWAAGVEGGVAIGAKGIRKTDVQALSKVGWDSMLSASFVGPELILLFGLFVWWRRRMVSA
jgi:ABC-type uncharacterized transport system involved in gliding motility auxiliary subunit